MPDDKLVRDPDELTPEERWRAIRMSASARPIVPPAANTTLPPPPDVTSDTLPTTSSARVQEPGSNTLAHRLESREQFLTDKLNPPRKTGWGRVGQVLGTVGQDIGTAVAPGVMARIPNTTYNRRLELEDVRRQLGEEQAREATAREGARRTDIEQGRLGVEQGRLDVERAKAGLGTIGESPNDIRHYTDENGEQHTERYVKFPGNAEWRDESQPGITLPSTGAAPSAAPPVPGTIPGISRPPTPPPGAPPPLASPQVAPAAQKRQYTYGPSAKQLSASEIAQANQEFAQFYGSFNKGQQIPGEFQLKPGATADDYARVKSLLEDTEKGASTEATRAANREATNARLALQRENEQRRAEEANAKMVRAVDNENRVHLMSRGDYEANKAEFKPNPIALAAGELDKATDHNTVINEMQARMNSAAEAAERFNWNDSGQKSIVMQAMEQVDKNYADNLIGIPILRFVADNLKKLGLAGATPETREYIIDILSLREAMLGQPKEITGGSRMMEKAVDALWSTLPSGVTPDRPWAMAQLRAAQSIIDRLRGSRVPIVEGFQTVPKAPPLYQHAAVNPKNKRQIFSDDMQHWVDEDGNPVR